MKLSSKLSHAALSLYTFLEKQESISEVSKEDTLCLATKETYLTCFGKPQKHIIGIDSRLLAMKVKYLYTALSALTSPKK